MRQFEVVIENRIRSRKSKEDNVFVEVINVS